MDFTGRLPDTQRRESYVIDLRELEFRRTDRRKGKSISSLGKNGDGVMQVEVGSLLEKGEHWDVFRADWMGMDVVVKITRKVLTEPEMKKLQSEVKMRRRMRHPNIIRLLGAYSSDALPSPLASPNESPTIRSRDLHSISDDGNSRNLEPKKACLITEYAGRGSLRDELNRRFETGQHGLPRAELLAVAESIASGMVYIHSLGYVHKDLQSRHVLLDDNMNAKVTGFGLSFTLPESSAGPTLPVPRNILARPASSLTIDSILSDVPDTPITDDEFQAGQTEDIFNFGVILWELFTGITKHEIGVPLSIPVNCYYDLAELMKACWHRGDQKLGFAGILQWIRRLFGQPLLRSSMVKAEVNEGIVKVGELAVSESPRGVPANPTGISNALFFHFNNPEDEWRILRDEVSGRGDFVVKDASIGGLEEISNLLEYEKPRVVHVTDMKGRDVSPTKERRAFPDNSVDAPGPPLNIGELVDVFVRHIKAGGDLTCVVLNVDGADQYCHRLVEVVPVVIGKSSKLTNDSEPEATHFVEGFYRGVQRGYSIKEAFVQGRGLVGTSDAFLLYHKAQTDPDSVFILPRRERRKEDEHQYFLPPLLPDDIVRRDDILSVMKKMFLSGSDICGLCGNPGIGKTVLAQMLCADKEIIEAFPDGIHWVTLGREAEERMITSLQADLAATISAKIRQRKPKTRMLSTESDEAPPSSSGGGISGLRRWWKHWTSVNEDNMESSEERKALEPFLRAANCLVVLEDVWSARYAASLMLPVNEYKNGSSNTHKARFLLTTRQFNILQELSIPSSSIVKVGTLNDEQSLTLLAGTSGTVPQNINEQLSSRVLKTCAGLPLALSIMGGMLGSDFERWPQVLDKLDQQRSSSNPEINYLVRASVEHLPRVSHPDTIVPDVPPSKIENTSTPTQDTHESDAETHLTNEHDDAEYQTLLAQNFLDIAIFADDSDIPKSVLISLWNHRGIEIQEARRMIEIFVARSLMRESGDGYVTVHDLVREYARSRLGKEGLHMRHRFLVNVFRIDAAADEGDWTPGPVFETRMGDGYESSHRYYSSYLCYHLAEAGMYSTLASNLTDWRWIQSRVQIAGVAGALADFMFLPSSHATPETHLVLDALRLSSAALTRHPYELGWQLSGRLEDLAYENENILALVQMARKASILHPMHSALVGPGSRSLMTALVGQPSSINDLDAFRYGSQGETWRAVSAAGDKTLKVWDLGSGTAIATLRGHTNLVLCVSVFAYGTRAVSGSNDNTVIVWDLDDFVPLRTLSGHKGAVLCVVVCEDDKRVVSGSSGDCTVRVWDVDTGKEAYTLRGHLDSVFCLAIVPGHNQVVSGSCDSTLYIWNLQEGTPIHHLTGHTHSVMKVEVTQIEQELVAVSSSMDTTLRMWNLNDGACIRVFSGHTQWVTSISLVVFEDIPHLISGSADETVRVWNMQTGESIRDFKGHQNWVTNVVSCRLSDKSIRIVSGSWDNTLSVWDLESGQEVFTLEGHSDAISCVAVYGDRANMIISGSRDNTLACWNVESGKQVAELPGHTAWMNSLMVHRNDSTRQLVVASGCLDDSIDVNFWDCESGVPVVNSHLELKGHSDNVTEIAVCGAASNQLISCSLDGSLKLWSLDEGKLICTLVGHKRAVNCLAVFDDGKRALSGSDSLAKEWNLVSGKRIRNLEWHSDPINCISTFTNDGVVCAISGSDDSLLKVWDISEDGDADEEILTLSGHSGPVTCVEVFKNDSSSIQAVSGSRDNTLRVWDLSDGRCIHVLEGHSNAVSCVVVRRWHDAVYAISGASDKTVKGWDLISGEELFSVSFDSGVHRLALAEMVPHGTVLWVALEDNNLVQLAGV